MFLLDGIYYCEIRYIPLPLTVRGFVLYDAIEDFYNIYINNKLSHFMTKKTIEHEFEHIRQGHFFSTTASVSDIENSLKIMNQGSETA